MVDKPQPGALLQVRVFIRKFVPSASQSVSRKGKRMKLQVSTLFALTVTFALFLLDGATLPALAQNQWDWWPDPTTHRGISSWVSYSSTYDNLWSDRTLADQEIGFIAQSGVEVVFLLISSSAGRPDLQRLSDRTDPFTADVQHLLNSFTVQNIRACAAILSDDFTGSDDQMQKFVLVDNLLAFNASRGPGGTPGSPASPQTLKCMAPQTSRAQPMIFGSSFTRPCRAAS
jgi:hypothetical protein